MCDICSGVKIFLAQYSIERSSGHALHQRAQRDEIGVAIEEARTGRVRRFLGKGQTEAGFSPLPGRIEIEIFAQAGEVRQQVADGDVVFPVRRRIPGRYFATGSFTRTSPFCTSCMTAVVVATTLVSDAMSKIVSAVMGSRRGSSARLPKALR